MIENTNKSKEPSNVEYVDVRKYIGVGSVNVVAINPNNAKLRELGWTVSEDTEEPKYVIQVEKNGMTKSMTRIRFMCKIMDLEEKPVVPLDFWISAELSVNKDGDKCKIIDPYVRTAWATREDVKNHRVPQYSNGPASISSNYKVCHRGEEELCNFLFKYLNITPLQMYDKKTSSFVPSKNPGKLTIDDWKALCAGNVREISEYIAQLPDNCVKVIFGVRSTDDNKTYQTFMNTTYIGNGAKPDRNTGEYTSARKAIDKFFEGHENSPYSFEAKPVKEWGETPSEVKDNSTLNFPTESTGEDNPEDDLPF